jgi:PTS system fructose-specific IIC component
MSLSRLITPRFMKLEIDAKEDPEQMEDPEHSIRYMRGLKESVLGEICDLFENAGAVGNRTKLLIDMVNREKKASTALGQGVAIPHVRTMQAKSFTAAFLRSKPGIWFDAPDGEPVHVFIAMVAPPYEDAQYLKAYKELGKAMIDYPDMVSELRDAADEQEVMRLLRFYLR